MTDKTLSALRYSAAILAPCALALLTACASAPSVVYKDRVVEVPAPVLTPIDPRLIADTPPRSGVPAEGPMSVGAALERLSAVEDSLHQCRVQLKALRDSQP